MRSMAAASLLLIAVAATAAQPVAPAPLAETPFPIGFASIATLNGGFLAQWRLDATIEARIDGIAVDENGRRTMAAARTLLPPPVAQPVGLIPARDHYTLAYFDPRFMLRFARVGADGTPEGDAGFDAYPNAPRTRWTADGSRILVVQYFPGAITGLLLDDSGRAIRRDIYLGASTNEFVDVLGVGDGFVLIRQATDGLTAQMINRDGTLGSPLVLSDPPDLGSPYTVTAATDGVRQMYLWNGSGGLTGVIVENGSVRHIAIAGSAAFTATPEKAVWTGSGYLVFVSLGEIGNRSAAVIRLDRDGNAIDASPVPILKPSLNASVALIDALWNGRIAYAIAAESRFAESRMIGITVRADGTVVQTESLSVMPARQNAVAAASDGLCSLAVWRESGFGKERLLASLLADGIAGPPIVISSLDGYIGEPVVAYGGGVYLIAFLSAAGISAVRIDRNGAPLDTVPLLVRANSDFLGAPAIAWRGDQFLVVAGGYNVIGGAFVTPAGVVGVPLLLGYGHNPALTWNGQEFALAFDVQEGGVIEYMPLDIYVARVAADGSPHGDAALVMRGAGEPLLATSGSESLLISRYGAFTGMWLDMHAAPISDPFVVMPHLGATNSFDSVKPVSAEWTGSVYAIAGHIYAGGTWQLMAGLLPPRGSRLESLRAEPSRPDRRGGSSVAIAAEGAHPRLFFSDLQDGGTSRVMVESIDSMLLLRGRRRAVTH